MTATRKEAVHFLHPFQVSMETNHRDIMVWEGFPRCRTSVRGTGHQWIPLTEASKSSFKVSLFVYKPVEQTLELLVMRNIRALTLMWRYCNGNRRLQYPVVLGDVQYYNDVTWASRRLKLPATELLRRLLRRTSKNTSKLRVTGPLWGESTGARWIPRTKGQWSGWCFHDMTSLWVIYVRHVKWNSHMVSLCLFRLVIR